MVADLYTIEDGDFCADPAVVSDHNALPPHPLMADQLVRPVKVMVLRMATEVLANNAIITDRQSSRAAQIGEFPDPYIISDLDAGADVVEGSTHNQFAVIPNTYVVPNGDPFLPKRLKTHLMAELHKPTKADFMRVPEGYPLAQQ
jgi:hypothetical protein